MNYLLKKNWHMIFLCTCMIFIIHQGLQPSYSMAIGNFEEKKVLVIDSFNQDMPVSDFLLKGLKERFEQQSHFKMTYYCEYLDLQRQSNNSAYIKKLPEYIKEKYSIQKPDLIIVHRRPAYDLLVDQGKEFFPETPVIFIGDERGDYSNVRFPPNFFQVIGSVDALEAFKVVLQVQPKTKQIYVLIGTTEMEKVVKEKMSRELEQLAQIVEIIYLDQMSVPAMLEKISMLTEDAVIINFFVFKDITGKNFSPHDVLTDVISHAKVPVYGIAKTYLGEGIFGGYLLSGKKIGNRVADIAIDIFQGIPKDNSKIELIPSQEYVFDWRELKRWKISERRLPLGSKVEFKEFGVWELYRWHVIIGSVLFFLETLLIVTLLKNRLKRKHAEEALGKLNAELEYKVAGRTHDLEIANQELRTAKENQEEMNRVLLQLNESLDRNSRTDMLTGLFNRRHITEKIHAEFEAFQQKGQRFSIIIADIDHFKQVNDIYGHNGGDFLLKNLAQEFSKMIRIDDTIGRWGGEEFLYLLPVTEIIPAMEIAEQIRSAIFNQSFIWEGKKISISMTFGVAVVGVGDTVDGLINRADQALYRGKNSGRNQVVSGEIVPGIHDSVERINWSDKWESGNQMVDNQHRQLLELAMNIMQLYVLQTPSLEITTELDRLINHLVQHFADEEKMLIQIGYSEARSHALIHKNILNEAMQFRDKFLQEEIKLMQFFDFFVGDIIMGHLLTDDVKFFSLVQKKEANCKKNGN